MENEKYVITELKMTTWACPTQWDGKLDNGDPIYIRYRWGELRVTNEKTDEIIFCHTTDEDMGGIMDNDELQEILQDNFLFRMEGGISDDTGL